MGQAPLITLDTSALYSLLNRRDPDHERVAAAFRAEAGPHLVPAATLGELAHLIESRLGLASLDHLLADFESGVLHLDRGEEDISRVRELVRRYEDLPLGFVDAAVISCAERSGGKILTLDPDFRVVAREGRISTLPA